MARPHSHPGGFTIIELMVTVAVVSVLLGLAVPAFTNIVRNNRMAAQANAVIGALNFARGETAKRGIPITICAAADDAAGDDADEADEADEADRNSCVSAADGATDWANGWIIFTDRTGTLGEFDGDDEVLQVGAMPAGGFSVSANGTFVRFGVGATPSTERTFTVLPTDTSVCLTTGARQITVGVTGRVNSAKNSCRS